MVWGDVNARARGLAGRLLSAAALRELAAARDLETLGRALGEAGYGGGSTGSIGVLSGSIEAAVRRGAAVRMAILHRWLGPRRGAALRIVLETEDRRSLRVLLRRAFSTPGGGMEPPLLPTPGLPERALEALAGAARDGPDALVRRLVELGHPLAPALERAGAARGATLLGLELAASRAWAERWLASSGGAGPDLVGFVRSTIDAENAGAALLLRSQGAGLEPESSFLDGGERLSLAAFVAAVHEATPEGARAALAAALSGGPLASALGRHAAEGVSLERAVTVSLIDHLRRRSLLEPLGAAPVLWYLLRLRAEAEALYRIVWGMALGEPPGRRLAMALPG